MPGIHLPPEFVALFWTHDLEEKRDLRVHLLKAAGARLTLRAQVANHEGTWPMNLANPALDLVAAVECCDHDADRKRGFP